MATVPEERVEVRAQARWVRTPARKARLVLDTIRGRSVPEARSALAFSTRAVSHEIEKVLRSAVANAEQNHGLVGDRLYVSACYADEGPMLKRWQPRARGRAGRIHKGSCHITICLAEMETGEPERERRAGLRRRGEATLPGAAEEPRRRLRRRRAAGPEEPAAGPEAVEQPAAEPEEVEEPAAEPEAVEQAPATEAAAEAEAPAEPETRRRTRAPRAKQESQTEAEAPEPPATRRTTRAKKEDEH
jgi:large subunit ribosomal protein L22